MQQQSAVGAKSGECYEDEDLTDNDNLENEFDEQCLEKDDRPGFTGVGSNFSQEHQEMLRYLRICTTPIEERHYIA